jgi:yecA family protein
MGMEGDPRRAGHESRGVIHRAADPAPAASGVARPPMSLDELDRWLRAPRQRKPAADGIAMLDGFVAAIVAGPATYEPLGWLCPLLGVTRDAINDGDTEEYAALAAAAQHHNALAVALSEAPGRFAPIFGRDAYVEAAITTLSRTIGCFIAAPRLVPMLAPLWTASLVI